MADFTIPFAPGDYYRNPYIGTIAEMLGRQNDAQQELARFNAQLALQRGDTAARAWTGAGQTIADMFNNIEAAKIRKAEQERQAVIDQRAAEADQRAQELFDVQLRNLNSEYDRDAEARTREEQQRAVDALARMTQNATRNTDTGQMMPVGPGFFNALPPDTQAGAQAVTRGMMDAQRQDIVNAEDDELRGMNLATQRAAAEIADTDARRLRGEVPTQTFGERFGDVVPASLANTLVPLTASGAYDNQRAEALMGLAIDRENMERDDARAEAAALSASPQSPSFSPEDMALASLAVRDNKALSGLTPTDKGIVMRVIASDPALRAQWDENRMAPIREQARAVLASIDALLEKPLDGDTEPRLTSAASAIYGNVFDPGRALSFLGGFPQATARAHRDFVFGKEVLDTIADMKAQSATGATGFGAMNASELTLLENATSILGNTDIDDATAASRLKELRDLWAKVLEDNDPFWAEGGL